MAFKKKSKNALLYFWNNIFIIMIWIISYDMYGIIEHVYKTNMHM